MNQYSKNKVVVYPEVIEMVYAVAAYMHAQPMNQYPTSEVVVGPKQIGD